MHANTNSWAVVNIPLQGLTRSRSSFNYIDIHSSFHGTFLYSNTSKTETIYCCLSCIISLEDSFKATKSPVMVCLVRWFCPFTLHLPITCAGWFRILFSQNAGNSAEGCCVRHTGLLICIIMYSDFGLTPVNLG